MEIRSYRAVFDLERRIYRVDRLRLNPSGVPVRGVAYFLVLVLFCAIATSLPGPGLLLGALPWYVRELAGPAALAALMTLVKIEGRPFHLAARALLSYAASPRRICGAGGRPDRVRHWQPAELLALPDGSEASMRRLRYVGPGAVRISVPHSRREWSSGPISRLLRRPQLTIDPLDGGQLGGAKLLELSAGARLRVR